jgi:hypothetical protein
MFFLNRIVFSVKHGLKFIIIIQHLRNVTAIALNVKDCDLTFEAQPHILYQVFSPDIDTSRPRIFNTEP